MYLLAGLLANLTCIQAELYEMEKQAVSLKEDPLWVVPYATVGQDYDDLLEDFISYAGVCFQQPCNTFTFLRCLTEGLIGMYECLW